MKISELFNKTKCCPICYNSVICNGLGHYYTSCSFRINMRINEGWIRITNIDSLIIYYKKEKIYSEHLHKDFKDFNEVKKYMEDTYYKVVNNLLFV